MIEHGKHGRGDVATADKSVLNKPSHALDDTAVQYPLADSYIEDQTVRLSVPPESFSPEVLLPKPKKEKQWKRFTLAGASIVAGVGAIVGGIFGVRSVHSPTVIPENKPGVTSTETGDPHLQSGIQSGESQKPTPGVRPSVGGSPTGIPSFSSSPSSQSETSKPPLPPVPTPSPDDEINKSPTPPVPSQTP